MTATGSVHTHDMCNSSKGGEKEKTSSDSSRGMLTASNSSASSKTLDGLFGCAAMGIPTTNGDSGSNSLSENNQDTHLPSATTSPTNSSSSNCGSDDEEDGSLMASSSLSAEAEVGLSRQSTSSKPKITLETAMLEVEARFLLNLPEEELASVERLFFQLEQAHWYYEDFLADDPDYGLPHFQLEGFTQALFTHSDCLRHLQERHADLVKSFNSYKYAVPVYGCVILSPGLDKMLLVCNWEKTVWGLPRGKINEGEAPIDCAARETYEETGYDPTGQLREEDSFTMVQNSKRMKMYIVQGVPEDFPFKPLVRKEVSEVKFFPFDAIPTKSYNVLHSVAHVRHWLGKRKAREEKQQQQKAKKKQQQGGGGRTPKKDRSVTKGQAGNASSSKQQRARSAPGSRQQGDGRMDPSDANNSATFGNDAAGWGVQDMFQANEKLTGRKFTYDGNPQRFGDYHANANTDGAAAFAKKSSKKKGAGGHGGVATTSTQEERARERAASVPPAFLFAKCASLQEIEGSMTGNGSIGSSSNQHDTNSMAPSVASLMGLNTSISSSTSSSSKTGLPSHSVLSCASLESVGGASEQVAQKLAASVPASAALPAAKDENAFDFTFDTQDILSALHF